MGKKREAITDFCAEAREEQAEAHDEYTREHDGLNAWRPRDERVDEDAPAPGQASAYRTYERHKGILALRIADVRFRRRIEFLHKTG